MNKYLDNAENIDYTGTRSAGQQERRNSEPLRRRTALDENDGNSFGERSMNNQQLSLTSTPIQNTTGLHEYANGLDPGDSVGFRSPTPMTSEFTGQNSQQNANQENGDYYKKLAERYRMECLSYKQRLEKSKKKSSCESPGDPLGEIKNYYHL